MDKFNEQLTAYTCQLLLNKDVYEHTSVSVMDSGIVKESWGIGEREREHGQPTW